MRRRRVLSLMAGVGAAALAGCSSGAGAGGGRTLRLALNQTEKHPSFVALTHFGDRLSRTTDGRWDIEVYPNETLGAQQEAVQLVSDGTIGMAIVSGTQLANLTEDFRVFNLPQVFDSIEHQMDVVNDPELVGALYSSLEDQNLTVLGGLTQGSRNLYTSKGPITEPADLAGMKIRVQESDIHTRMIELMGGSATPMSYGEVYTALQSGVLDGAENNAVSYVSQKHHEVAGHYSCTNHLIGVDYLVMNTERLAGMSPADRVAFDREWKATSQEHADLWKRATEEAVARAEADGAQFHRVDTEAFSRALQPLIDQYLDTDTARRLYEAVRSASP